MWITSLMLEEVLINSFAPGKFEWNFRYVIFQGILVTDGWGISCEIALIWMSVDFTDDQSTLVQVMAWCCLATRHYLNQCWPRSPAPYCVTMPQWVNLQLGHRYVPIPIPRVTLYTAGHLHTAVPHCSHSRAPLVHTAVPRENNEHGCVYLRCRAVCKLPGCVEGHPCIPHLRILVPETII